MRYHSSGAAAETPRQSSVRKTVTSTALEVGVRTSVGLCTQLTAVGTLLSRTQLGPPPSVCGTSGVVATSLVAPTPATTLTVTMSVEASFCGLAQVSPTESRPSPKPAPRAVGWLPGSVVADR